MLKIFKSIRIKLFLPLALLFLGVLLFFWLVLLPHTIRVSTQDSQILLQTTLGTLSEALVPLVRDNRLSDVNETLDHVSAQNPSWGSLSLLDNQGQVIYPAQGFRQIPRQDNSFILEQALETEGERLGTLRLVYDFSNIAAEIKNDAYMLLATLLVALSLFVAMAAYILYCYIISPTMALCRASEALMQGDYDVVLPDAKQDVIGLLVQIFSKMRDNIKATSLALIKEKKEAEKVAQIPDNNPNPVIQIALDGTVLYANKAAQALFPTLSQEGFNHPILTPLERYIKLHTAHGLLQKTLTQEISFNGSFYRQTITSCIVSDREALLVYCYDITDIKDTQQKAFLLEEAVEAARDGILITTPDINNPIILYANDAMRQISGYETNELLGKTPHMLQGPMTSREEIKRLKSSLSEGKSYQGEIQNYTKSGVCYWLDISIVPIKNDQGEITYFAAIERDITTRKAFEKELQINREAAEVANRSKDSFLANMSHELRTPMNGIIGLSEMMIDMDLSPEAQELADAVNSSSRNLLILLNDILDLSKIEAKELTLEYIPFNLRFTIRQTMDLLRPLASRKSISLDYTVDENVPDSIMGDPARIQQVLNNLIGNAIKFTSAGFVKLGVTCKLDEDGEMNLFLDVADSGIGISEDQGHTIFHKFNQADTSTSRKYGGTGLGLSITKELVEMMGGVISFESEIGEGTVFSIELPIEEVSGSLAADMIDPLDGSQDLRTDARLMVVDDHPVNLLFMQRVLAKLGFEHVDSACTGREAIDLTQRHDYDLILMDCQMPEMDGFEASTHIREREADIGDITIVAVTADAMKGARERCIDAGMNDYISKPVDTEKLRSILAKWIPAVDDSSEKNRAPSKTAFANMDVKKLAEESTADVADKVDQTIEESEPTDSDLIDWERLELFSDGDPKEKAFLIDLFITHADDSVVQLESLLESSEEEWQQASHKFKGSAANLGAYSLAELCAQAEATASSSPEEKRDLLNDIIELYEKVKSALAHYS